MGPRADTCIHVKGRMADMIYDTAEFAYGGLHIGGVMLAPTTELLACPCKDTGLAISGMIGTGMRRSPSCPLT